MKILVFDTENIHTDALEMLKKDGYEVEMSGEMDLLKEGKLPEADVILIRIYNRVDKAVLDKAGRLKAIVSCSVGLDHIEKDECTKRNIEIFNAPGSNSNAVAEHTVALILGVLRRVVEATKHVKSGKWDRKRFMAYELEGKTMGFIGFGMIGKLVAQKLKGFGIHHVLVYDPYLNRRQIKMAGGEKMDDLHDLIKHSEIISLHLPLTEETKNLIGEGEIALMGPETILVNTSRGGIVDENALIKALKNGRIYGAGLDVFEQEPPSRLRFMRVKNVVLTPHIGTMTNKAFRDMSVQATENFLKGFKKK